MLKRTLKLLRFYLVGFALAILVYVMFVFDPTDDGVSITGNCISDGFIDNPAKASNRALGLRVEHGTHRVNMCPGDSAVYLSQYLPEVVHIKREGEPEARIGQSCGGGSQDHDVYVCDTGRIGPSVWIPGNFQMDEKWPGGLRLDVTTYPRP